MARGTGQAAEEGGERTFNGGARPAADRHDRPPVGKPSATATGADASKTYAQGGA